MNGDRLMIQDLARRVRALEDRLSPPDAAPQPPTLRVQVAEALARTDAFNEALGESYTEPSSWLPEADAVLAVVADWLAAQPFHHPSVVFNAQRDHDVALIRDGGTR